MDSCKGEKTDLKINIIFCYFGFYGKTDFL